MAGYGRSHPNLAVIKYWGKSDMTRNIPSGPSVSFCLSRLTTETSVEYSDADEFHLNGANVGMKDRMRLVVEMFRKRAGDGRCVRIRSANSFPDSCGLASSASGFSALVVALDDFYRLGLSKTELSELARIGSGSASRSVFSGVVVFEGLCSRHLCFWPEIRILVIVVCDEDKKVGSSEGMVRTADTSCFYRERLCRIRERYEKMVGYICRREFREFAELTMRESNEFHSVLMETYPPIRYIGDAGFRIMEMCHEFNEKEVRVAYTFDAGPNPFLITLEEYLDDVKNSFRAFNPVLCN